MENNSGLNNTFFKNDNIKETNSNGENDSYDRTNLSPAIGHMIAEGGETFFHYLKDIGLAKDPNLLVLSSNHHYYYDDSDLRSIRTLINLKKLNFIKHLDSFLQTLFRILPANAHFIGCFSDNKTQNGNAYSYYPSRLFNRFINFLDARTDRNMGKDDVSRLFESYGFKVVDMTDINGETYFSTHKN